MRQYPFNQFFYPSKKGVNTLIPGHQKHFPRPKKLYGTKTLNFVFQKQVFKHSKFALPPLTLPITTTTTTTIPPSPLKKLPTPFTPPTISHPSYPSSPTYTNHPITAAKTPSTTSTKKNTDSVQTHPDQFPNSQKAILTTQSENTLSSHSYPYPHPYPYPSYSQTFSRSSPNS
eukprot:TRINITY_DN2909_c0_g1_i4.p4 TRINITY_DN2909_c0_g1~~TRINITY_DN2909_c0_g1_i4.p4  ORF type:complete len:173 (-),score=13.62 TRINITY_DN2909_c0_g1_i4:985-1503(-)